MCYLITMSSEKINIASDWLMDHLDELSMDSLHPIFRSRGDQFEVWYHKTQVKVSRTMIKPDRQIDLYN